ncbi:hypothetical protein [Streptomyces sp. NPDC059649]|uniref:hypothetical protein n=1 Tax=Streptomyces sp. NPDC059649 TaxID=3346895 RepID=UPI003692C2C0
MTIDDERLTRLRTAATAGDADAAFALGRLLCLTATGPADVPEDLDGAGQSWPEEPWLRAALGRHPDHVPAMTLLAGRLAQQIDFWQNMCELDPEAAEAYGEDDTTLGRRQAEVQELLARAGAAGPAHHTAGPYGFYVLDDTGWSGSAAHCATIVAARPDELRWACDQWFSVVGGCGLSGAPTLTAYAHGEEVSVVHLAEHFDRTVDWDAVPLPPLTGEELPPGLPVPGSGLHYGFAGRVE